MEKKSVNFALPAALCLAVCAVYRVVNRMVSWATWGFHFHLGLVFSLGFTVALVVMALACWRREEKLFGCGTLAAAACEVYFLLETVVWEVRYGLSFGSLRTILSEALWMGAFLLVALALMGKEKDKTLALVGVGACAAAALLNTFTFFRWGLLVTWVEFAGLLLAVLLFTGDIPPAPAGQGAWTAPARRGVMSDAVLHKLVELKKLLDEGVLTEAEFAAKRDTLLGRDKPAPAASAENAAPAESPVPAESPAPAESVPAGEDTPGESE